ncbi:hypothetical protein LGM39_28165 [Burkholderia cepacia]|uniref:hypothetical protein n=1 Tax=Burkholderia cepacia TaxID=292 RepID=UPI001CF4C6F1|nr:hypothetical protein [Burkholderia cepacia]MCA7903253.1 hypothetical protein [Burkholderia cepacia]
MKIEGVLGRVDTGLVKLGGDSLPCLYRIEVAGHYYFCDPGEFAAIHKQIARANTGSRVYGMAYRTRSNNGVSWLIGDGFELAPKSWLRQGLWATLIFIVSLGLMWPLGYLILGGGDNLLSRIGGFFYSIALLISALVGFLGFGGGLLSIVRIVTAFPPHRLCAEFSYRHASRHFAAKKA